MITIYAKSTWVSGDLISAAKANNWETQYQETGDGWIDSSTETWTYNSSGIVVITGDKSTKYQKGHKVRLVQTSTKYFYITNITISTAAGTIVTVTGGSDYTLASTTITSPAYSAIETPFGFPGWFNWTPIVTGFSTAPTATVYRFKISDNSVTTIIRQGISGASSTTSFTISAPVNAASTITNGAWINPVAAEDNSISDATAFIGILSTNNTLLQLYRGGTPTGWTAAGTKRANGQLTYEI